MRGFSLCTLPQKTVLPIGHQTLTPFKEIIAFFSEACETYKNKLWVKYRNSEHKIKWYTCVLVQTYLI